MRRDVKTIHRGWRWAIGVLAGVTVAWWIVASLADSEEGDWVDVRRDDLILTAEISGTLQAVDTSLLGPPQIPNLWEYKLSRLAPEGTEVKVGTPVFAFDTSELERRLEEKKAERDTAQKEIEKRAIDLEIKRRDDELRLAEAEARRNKARLKVERPPEIAQANELAQARLDLALAEREIGYLKTRIASERRAADAEMASLRQRRDRAASRVAEIEDAISRMTVEAPRDGTVVYVTSWREEKKKVGDSVWRGESVVEIPNLSRMKGVGEIDEADAGRVAVNQRVSLRLDAHPDVEFSGTVRSLWGTVQRKSWNSPLRVMRLDVELERTDTRRMRPGMRFTGTVETGRVSRTIVVPADAVFPTPEGPIAWRKTAFGSEKVQLSLGRRTASAVEVLQGLAEGDRVSRVDLGREESS